MTKTEVSKLLYKQKPTAEFHFIQFGIAHYSAWVQTSEDNRLLVPFTIPVKEMGNGKFNKLEEAQLLRRWIDM